tara:strand:+ start:3497 stop:4597 length:1101 start_codon:yes stop_codon:yes gene_type:complete
LTAHPYELTSDCIVFANSGPSLNKVDVFSLGYPVAAVSTSVRSDQFKDRKPDIWILADKLNDMHGERGKELWQDPEVIKVMPELRRKDINRIKNLSEKDLEQWYFCDYNSNRQKRNHGVTEIDALFSGRMPFIRGPHKSVTFGIQWLHYMGAKNIIWTGCDLTAPSLDQKYAYKTDGRDSGKRGGYLRTLNVVDRALREWYPVALKKGYEWYNWECGEALTNIGLPDYIGKGEKKKITVTIPPPPQDPPRVGPAVTHRAPVREIRKINRRRHSKSVSVNINRHPGAEIPPKNFGVVDKYGRSISEPFVDAVPVGNLDDGMAEIMANLPPEPIMPTPEYIPDEKQQKKNEQDFKQEMKLRQMKRKLK